MRKDTRQGGALDSTHFLCGKATKEKDEWTNLTKLDRNVIARDEKYSK